MAAVITNTATRITITGAYKEFTGSSSITLVTRSGGDSPAAGDVGRFILWCRGGTVNTGQWEVRRIVAATATTVTPHDAWGAVPTAGDTFRISSTLSDILAAQPTAGTKTGHGQFAFVGDLSLASAAFLGSANESAEWVFTLTSSDMPMADNCVLQLGQAWGGEGLATETTDGCRWNLRAVIVGSNSSSLYSTLNSRSESGPVVNFYGSLIESSLSLNESGNWIFQRMRGPARFIGSTFDGAVGGRFYHESSEWVDCRMSSGNSLVTAWSIGAAFTRPINSIKSYRNLMAMKSFLQFGGVVKNTTFSNNTDIFQRDATDGTSVFDFIDCTEFDASDIGGNRGIINQSRSVNLTITDEAGVGVTGAVVRINDKDDTTQGAVSTSVAGGAVPEILARRRRFEDNSIVLLQYSPFRIRIRKFGYLWDSLNAAIADPIKQSSAMRVDSSVTQSSAVAAAHTGITIVDHGASPVSWNSKNFGITVTGNLTSNPSLTITDIKHYLHWHLAQSAAIGGKASGLAWHNLIPMAGFQSERGSYGAVTKGVRVIDQAGNPFPGVVQMQADDGTFYLAPASATILAPALISGSRVQLYNQTDGVELLNIELASAGLTLVLPYTGNKVVRLRADHATKLPLETAGVLTASGLTFLDVQAEDDVYLGNGIDGGSVTEFAPDGAHIEVDINDPDGVTGIQRLYAWLQWYMTTEEGVRSAFFGAVSAIDSANYVIDQAKADIRLDNVAAFPVRVVGGYLSRRDGSTVIAPLSHSIQMDPGKAYAIETGVSGLTADEGNKLNQISLLALETTAQSAATAAAAAAVQATEAADNTTTLLGQSAPTAAAVAAAVWSDAKAGTLALEVTTQEALAAAELAASRGADLLAQPAPTVEAITDGVWSAVDALALEATADAAMQAAELAASRTAELLTRPALTADAIAEGVWAATADTHDAAGSMGAVINSVSDLALESTAQAAASNAALAAALSA